MTTELFEAEIAPGLEKVAESELKEFKASIVYSGSGLIQFSFKANPKRLFDLKTINAVYFLKTLDVPRPKALLGHQHFTAMVALVKEVQQLNSSGSFKTLNIDAAGSESSVMQRIKSELAGAVGLQPAPDKGDLLIRLRPSKSKNGWDALVRLTPRPLATREWRVQNYEGSINASVAHAMIRLTQPEPDDTFLNLCSGSGTLLIERMTHPARLVVGCDIDAAVLHFAQSNIRAANVHPHQLQTDVTALPFETNSFNKLCADLPFGQLVGSHQANATLYPAVLEEAARVACSEALFVIITHEIRLIETLLSKNNLWKTEQIFKITLNGLHPRVYVLRRTSI